MKNRCQKNTWFSTLFFLDFSSFWPPKTKPKSSFFRYFFENVDFVKIVLPSKRNCYFSGSELPKNDPKSILERTRTKHRKNTRPRRPTWTPKAPSWLPPNWPPKMAFMAAKMALWALLGTSRTWPEACPERLQNRGFFDTFSKTSIS